MNRIFFLLLCLFVSGCVPKKVPRKPAVETKGQYDELVARVSSIPDTPFFSEIQGFEEDPESKYNIIVRYGFSGEVGAVKDFYIAEMERSGWVITLKINTGDTSALVFEKPKLMSVIEIRPKDKRYTLALGRKISF